MSEKRSGGERRVAVVTGGATGVGAASALALARRQYNVVINFSRSEAAANGVAERCRALGSDALVVQGDVASDADCRRIIDVAAGRWRRIDALINSAGTTQFAPIGDLERQGADDFQRVYAVNVVGPFQMARAAAPHLRRSNSAAIVNISSIAGLTGSGSSMPYVTSKGALNTLTLALARNLAPEIRVNAILPGMIEGRWLKEGLGAEAYQRVRDQFASAAALGRVCTPDEIAEAAAWLTDGAAMMTGQLITVDGGFLLGRPPRVAR